MQGEAGTANPAADAAADGLRPLASGARSGGRSWRPAPSIQLTVAGHGAAAAAALVDPMLWPWALGAVAASHAWLLAGGLTPGSSILGPNLVRLSAAAVARRQVALTFDDGPDAETTPRVLDLLDAAGVRATFFCIGRRARELPSLVREIAARGHAVENHGDSHSRATAMFGYARLRDDIAAAQETLAELSGRRPRYFRPLGGFRNPWLDPILHGLDLRQACWTRRGLDSVRRNPQAVLRRLARRLAAGDILLLHDGDAARTEAGNPVSVEVLPPLLAALRAAGLQAVTLPEAAA